MNPISRRQFLLGAAGSLCAPGAYAGFVEPRWFDVTHHRVRLGAHPADPSAPSAETIRLLHLTDLHVSWPMPLSLIEEGIAAGLAENPDIICLTGDYVTDQLEVEACDYSQVLSRLSAAAPTFAVFGNHDGGDWADRRRGYRDQRVLRAVLEDAGIEVLHNRSLTSQVRDTRLNLAGVADYWSKEIDGDRAFREIDPEAKTVVLAHNPDSKDPLQRRPWDLMLSGHTHGGQVVLPILGTSFAPVRDHRFVAGLNFWEDRGMSRPIYTSRGVGGIYRIRFNCRPEVTVLDVEV